MNDLTWILIVAGLLLLVVIVAGAVALTSGRRRRGPSAPLPPVDVSPYEPDQAEPAGATAVETLPRPEPEPEAPAEPVSTPTLERPAPVAGRMQRLRARLARSGTLGQSLLSILSRGELSETDWEEIEETLLLADVGIGPTTELMDTLRTRTKVLGTTDAETVRGVLREELLQLVDPTMDRALRLGPVLGDDGEPHPATVLVVGVNGTGKTTTVGKLARVLVAEDHDVVLGAADTFRAAAADQLSTWGQRVGVPVVRSDREGADPASVAFDAVRHGRESGADVVLVDTAGRLQNKADLMDELGKIKRVMSRQAPVTEVLLVLDATTGQNGLRQAQVFADVVDITGIVLTKLDGTAKGGIVVAVQRELGVPVKFVGLGEGPDDLAPFEPAEFVDALLS
ncbi:signal recognition particle-docking protein FtsY [Georgenia sp. TF02-10]|uniref:signal recognition particle-docking protein FtsY n=1 Tax=Georgenia sp. TF02-10 TaxID=2917725 RepID=UPI001FA7520F|nr:signal recognition particle-docking protein FtsY [Georgenia sp. TF02-10]UNX55885.1 signal recognition particle-docking protein FtsY [Georgenia sp. TF02-10]